MGEDLQLEVSINTDINKDSFLLNIIINKPPLKNKPTPKKIVSILGVDLF